MGLILKRRCGQTLNLQVRSVGSDGKIWINSDSFLPQTLIGNEVTMFTEVDASVASSFQKRRRRNV